MGPLKTCLLNSSTIQNFGCQLLGNIIAIFEGEFSGNSTTLPRNRAWRRGESKTKKERNAILIYRLAKPLDLSMMALLSVGENRREV